MTTQEYIIMMLNKQASQANCTLAELAAKMKRNEHIKPCNVQEMKPVQLEISVNLTMTVN